MSNNKIKYVEAMTGHHADVVAPDLAADTEVKSIDVRPAFATEIKATIVEHLTAQEPPCVAEHNVDQLVDALMDLIRESPYDFDVDLDFPELPEYEGVALEPIGTSESVARQMGNAFLHSELVAIIRLEDLQRLIANQVPECERIEAAVA